MSAAIDERTRQPASRSVLELLWTIVRRSKSFHSKEAAISIDAVEGDQRPGVELGPPTPRSSQQALPAGVRR